MTQKIDDKLRAALGLPPDFSDMELRVIRRVVAASESIAQLIVNPNGSKNWTLNSHLRSIGHKLGVHGRKPGQLHEAIITWAQAHLDIPPARRTNPEHTGQPGNPFRVLTLHEMDGPEYVDRIRQAAEAITKQHRLFYRLSYQECQDLRQIFSSSYPPLTIDFGATHSESNVAYYRKEARTIYFMPESSVLEVHDFDNFVGSLESAVESLLSDRDQALNEHQGHWHEMFFEALMRAINAHAVFLGDHSLTCIKSMLSNASPHLRVESRLQHDYVEFDSDPAARTFVIVAPRSEIREWRPDWRVGILELVEKLCSEVGHLLSPAETDETVEPRAMQAFVSKYGLKVLRSHHQEKSDPYSRRIKRAVSLLFREYPEAKGAPYEKQARYLQYASPSAYMTYMGMIFKDLWKELPNHTVPGPGGTVLLRRTHPSPSSPGEPAANDPAGYADLKDTLALLTPEQVSQLQRIAVDALHTLQGHWVNDYLAEAIEALLHAALVLQVDEPPVADQYKKFRDALQTMCTVGLVKLQSLLDRKGIASTADKRIRLKEATEQQIRRALDDPEFLWGEGLFNEWLVLNVLMSRFGILLHRSLVQFGALKDSRIILPVTATSFSQVSLRNMKAVVTDLHDDLLANAPFTNPTLGRLYQDILQELSHLEMVSAEDLIDPASVLNRILYGLAAVVSAERNYFPDFNGLNTPKRALLHQRLIAALEQISLQTGVALNWRLLMGIHELQIPESRLTPSSRPARPSVVDVPVIAEKELIGLGPFGTPDATLDIVRWPDQSRNERGSFEIMFKYNSREVGHATGDISEGTILITSIGNALEHSAIGASFFRWAAWQGHFRGQDVRLSKVPAGVLLSCQKAGLILLVNNTEVVNPGDEDLRFKEPFASWIKKQSPLDVVAKWPNPLDRIYPAISPIGSRSGSVPKMRPNISAYLLRSS